MMQPGAYQPAVFNARMFKLYGMILALLSGASLALGIADVVLTMMTYCDPWVGGAPMYCSGIKEPYIWTWVASGIWASVPIFMAGLFAMCLSANPARWTRCFALLIFLSAIVFSPAMIVLSSIEVWRGHASMWNFYKMGDSLMEGNILVEDSPYKAKFAIPLVIAILGGIMFVMSGIITLTLCCCMQSIGIYLPQEIPVQQVAPAPAVVQTREIYFPPRPQIRSQLAVDYQPNYQPAYQATTGQFLATRYNSVPDPYGSGVCYGNFPSRAFTQPSSFASDFFKPNPSYFWK